jgi:diguanylate cyclase (GGDEF)-like protein/PAS domain S-box-containing protein
MTEQQPQEMAGPAHSADSSAMVQPLDPIPSLMALLERIPLAAIQSIDRDGIVRLWNRTSAELYGIPGPQAIGQPLHHLVPRQGQQQEFAAALQQIWNTGEPPLPRDWQIAVAGGKPCWVYSTLFPVFRGGQVHRIFCLDFDVTERKLAEQGMFVIGVNFRALFDRTADAIMLIRDGQIAEINPAALALFGYASKAEIGGHYPDNLSPQHQPDGQLSADKARAMMALAHETGNQRFEWLHLNRERTAFWTEVLLTLVPVNGESLLYAVVRDISERKAAEQSLYLAAQVFESGREAILITDQDQKIISINKAFSDLTGYPPEQVIGKTPHMFCSGKHDSAFYQELWSSLQANDHWQGEIWDRHHDGHHYPLWLGITAVRNKEHRITNYIGMCADISARKASEEYTRHLAEHDFLTDLPNRVLLLDRMGQALEAARRNQTQVAVLYLDLDRFKYINDSLGHAVGDQLLQTVAERLRKCVRGVDTVSRHGGDEFLVMLADIGGVGQAAHLATNVLQALAQPYRINDYEFVITTSIGISIYPDDGDDTETLIRNADTAMYHAKESGRNSYQFYSEEMNVRIMERITLENSLKRAIGNQEFVLQYQPELEMHSGKVIGAEALLRWNHPDFGMLSPARFIAVAEDCGLLVPIGDWVLRTACRQARLWRDKGWELVVSVNISMGQFRQKNLLQSVIDALDAASLEPYFLELEITEGLLMEEGGNTLRTLNALKQLGVRLAIDDFGIGYSSLNYLKRFPIDKLKIDQSFVHDISTGDPDDAAVISAIIVMAKSLHFKVIAEGVETHAQYVFLQENGCDECQGNYLGPPMLAAEMGRYLRAH